jgi:SpoVK/Ycf46/Vps4 family AAA+-type ATPase
LRKGRFDEVFFVDLPTTVEREQILSVHLGAKGRVAADFDLQALAKRAEFFTGAELEAVITSGLFRAFKRGGELTTEDLSVAIDQTVPLYRTYEEPIKALRAWAKTRARRASTDLRLTELWTRAS